MIDLWAEQSDKFIGTTAAIISAIGAGIGAGASVFGAHQQAEAAENAAHLQTDAATHAADVQDAAAQRAEAFQREQADYAARQAETDRRGTYDQWAAGRRYQGSLSRALGLGGMAIPDYVPGATPNFSTGPGRGAPAPTRPQPQMRAAAPVNFGDAMTSSRQAPPALDPRVMGGNGGFTGGMDTPQLQADGTYVLGPSMPPPRYRTFGQYLGAA